MSDHDEALSGEPEAFDQEQSWRLMRAFSKAELELDQICKARSVEVPMFHELTDEWDRRWLVFKAWPKSLDARRLLVGSVRSGNATARPIVELPLHMRVEASRHLHALSEKVYQINHAMSTEQVARAAQRVEDWLEAMEQSRAPDSLASQETRGRTF